LYLAIGILLVASKDLVIEIGHSFLHSPEYISGKMKVHSHKIGNKVVVHHDHKILNKVDKATEKMTSHDSEDRCQNVQVLKLDQLKLISQDLHPLSSEPNKEIQYYNYRLKLDQTSGKLPTPPPQFG